MKSIIQTINRNDFHINLGETINKLALACKTTGFFELTDHGMDQSIIEKGETDFKKFLTVVPPEHRMNYSYPEKGYQIGYTPPKIETGEFAKVADEKHFFHVFPDDMPFIKEVPTFKENTSLLWQEFNKLGTELMRYIAISMDEFNDFFAEKPEGTKAYSLLRGLHYPAGQKPVDDDEAVMHGGNVAGMCASKHTDINLITLLLAKEPGLQLWFKNKWVPITMGNPNSLIVNVGDLLQHITNGAYKSGLHRVVCEPGKERFSEPFFLHTPDEFNITPLSQFGVPKPEFRFTTAKEFVDHRLKQIGLTV